MEGIANGQVRFVRVVVGALMKRVGLLKAFLGFTQGHAIGIGLRLLFGSIFIEPTA